MTHAVKRLVATGLKAGGWFLFGLLWLVVAWLSLEVGAAAYTWWTVRHNPYILSARQYGGDLRNVEFPPPGAKPPASPPIAAPPSVPQGHPAPAEWERPILNPTPGQVENRRRAFPGLSMEDRQYFATLHNDMVVEFDAAGAVKNHYGKWMREDIDFILEQYRNARKHHATHYADIELGDAEARVHIPFFFLHDPATDRLFGFTNLEELVLKAEARELPPDSPWEVPFFRYKKNLRDSHSGLGQLGFTTNNFGFRGPDVAVPKPAGVFRIVCIGGSTTEEGAEDGTYPYLMEQRLRAAYPGKRLEVVNCGICGMTTTRHLLRLPEYLQLEPDLIVLYEGVNDIAHDLIHVWHGRKSVWQSWIAASPFIRQVMNRMLFPSDTTTQEGLEALPLANMRALIRAARANGVPTLVCGLACPDMASISRPERQYFDYNARAAWECPYLSAGAYGAIVRLFRDGLKRLCEQDRVPYVPVEEEVYGGLHYFVDICHMTRPGIEKKAELIARYVTPYLPPAP